MPKTLATVLVVLLVTIAVPSEIAAQDPNQGNPTLLKAVQDVQSSVNALATQVANITNLGGNVATQLTNITSQLTSLANVVNALATPPNVITTGFLFKPSGFSASCAAVNAGTSGVTVKADLVKLGGQVQQTANLVLGPGDANGFGLAVGSAAQVFWCRFTMITGSSADIRANLDVVSEATGLSNMIREAR